MTTTGRWRMIWRFPGMVAFGGLVLQWVLGAAVAAGAEAPVGPKADPRACIVSGDARFTILTPALIRMEHEHGAKFEDRATYAFINRRLPVPMYTINRLGGWIDIRTSEVQVRYRENSGAFNSENLAVTIKHTGVGADSPSFTWHPGTTDTANLLGTVRTLDSVNGARPLEPGILSRDGWAVVDDTTRTLLTTDAHKPGDLLADWPWAGERPADPARQDLYFFGYGRDYKRALRDFMSVAGKTPLPPKWAFGAWWSRYWAYTDKEFKELVHEFRSHGVPLDVLVIDMDWHLDGWTGYTWNPKYFPDPAGFLKWAHEEGLHVTMNLHPADGVGPQEAAYPEFAKAMGVDASTSQPVSFDITNARFVDSYFRLLHHPLEKQGVDFWWIDWQQGTHTKLSNIDPLHWLNYLHWTDMERNADRAGLRPLLFSRWGGLGNHRYQTGFSGDTYNDWPSLAFQPYFTSTAGNVGYSYWSHDIGGHIPGPVAPDLFDRWLQWAAFNPILRTHGGNNPATERRIWAFPEETYNIAKQAWLLRYSLIPYIYSAARQCYDTGLPLCRPLYYEWPALDEAYAHGGEYLYGNDLLVHPVVERADDASSCALQKTWLPPGVWIDWFTDEVTTGPAEIDNMVSMDRIPVWARAGAIIPTASVRRGKTSQWAMQDDEEGYRRMHVKDNQAIRSTADQADNKVCLDVFPGRSGEAVLYQDDRNTTGYQVASAGYTTISKEVSADGSVTTLTIEAMHGEYPGAPKTRSFEFRMRSLGHVMTSPRILVNGTDKGSSGSGLMVINPACFGDYIVEETPEFSTQDRVQFVFETASDSHAGALAAGGVRGQIDLLREISQLTTRFGGRTIGVQSPGQFVNEVCAAGGETTGTANSLNDRAMTMLKRLTPGAEKELQKYLLRLLGLTTRLEVKADSNGNLIAHVIVHRVRGTEPLEISGELKLGTGLNVSSVPPFGSKATLEAGQTEAEIEWKIPSPTKPERVDVRAQISFSYGGMLITIPLSTTLLPSIGEWDIVGPFDNAGGITLDKVFPPEEQAFTREAIYQGKGRLVRWKHIARKIDPKEDLTGEFVVDLHKEFGGHTDKAVAYARTIIHSEMDTFADLYIGADDGVAAWMNGKEVWRNAKGRPYRSREDHVRVALKKGDNELLLKISQGNNDWKFAVHVDPVGMEQSMFTQPRPVAPQRAPAQGAPPGAEAGSGGPG